VKNVAKHIAADHDFNMCVLSVPESDSYEAESEFDEQDVSDVSSTVVKFVNRFTDKVCGECGVTADHIKSLHAMIPGGL